MSVLFHYRVHVVTKCVTAVAIVIYITFVTKFIAYVTFITCVTVTTNVILIGCVTKFIIYANDRYYMYMCDSCLQL